MRWLIAQGALVILTVSACSPAPPPDPELSWVDKAPGPTEPPQPPPGGHDSQLEWLPTPLSVANARRVLTEATVWAPRGVGLAHRPMQSMAVKALLDQPRPGEVLEEVYQDSEMPGKLLALCGLRKADNERVMRLASPLLNSPQSLTVYEGCIGEHRAVRDLVSEILKGSACEDVFR